MGDSTEGPDQGTDVRTFLIADVRGYTKYTQQHGDQAAAHLAAGFAELVRQVIEARQGFLVEVRGDEALVVFVSARQALRAAVELQARIGESGLGRGVGIGLDSGEAIPLGDGYRGGALNLAARLCAQAKTGEILASESVIHLAAKVDGVAYVDPRTFRLKGYDDPVRAVEVVAADRARAYTLRHTLGRRTRRLVRRRGFRVAAAVAVVIAVLAVLLPLVVRGGATSPLLSDPPGMSLLDARTGHQLGFIPASRVKSPVEAIYADGHFWVLNLDPASFVEIDPKTGAVLRQIASPVAEIGSYGAGGGFLWVTDYTHPVLVKVDVARRREVRRWTLSDDPTFPGGLGGGLVADGSVWVNGAGDLFRVDPSTGTVQHTFKDVQGCCGIAAGDGSIWASGNPDGNGISRIDPRTNVIAATARVSGGFSFVAAGGGFGWTADEVKGVVFKVDPRGDVVATYPTGEGAREVSFDGGSLWVGNQDVGTVSGIDAVTGTVTTYRFAHPLGFVAAGSGSVLVNLGQGRTYEDRINALQGKVAKFLVGPYQLGYDPSTDYTGLAFEVEFATCATLLNYQEAPAPQGWQLRPEVAASMPDVSSDGTTYTFTIRTGYRFSPPSNQPVTAETFRYSIERALSPKVGQYGPPPGSTYVDDIQGEKAFLAGKAEHISGLRAEGSTLTIVLTKPSADLLTRLAMPFFCPVPTDTPLVPQGAAIQSQNGTIVEPSAGPYYVAEALGGEYTILKRNPNYAGPRPHALDAIALREGIDPGQAVSRVETARWDGLTNLGDAVVDDPRGVVAGRWDAGGTSASSEGRRYYPVPGGGDSWLFFNAGRAPFADRSVREAVAYALDRSALAKVAGGGVPSDQLLPPNQPGAPATGRFPVDGPDLAKARELMRGKRVTAVLVTNPFGPNPLIAEAIKAELAPIGITVRIEHVENSLDAIHTVCPVPPQPGPACSPGSSYDLKVAASGLDPMGSTIYLKELFVGQIPLSGMADSVLPRAWQSAATRATAARLRDVATDAQALALLDKPILQDVPMTGLGYSVSGALFAPRLGCRLFPPAGFGVDFAALCLNGSS